MTDPQRILSQGEGTHTLVPKHMARITQPGELDYNEGAARISVQYCSGLCNKN